MTTASAMADRLTDDFILPFQVGDTAVRGRIVRLAGTIDDILGRHRFDDDLSELLGEAAALVTAMGASLKFDGKLIFQAHGEGPVSMLVADYAADGSLRATASRAAEPAAGRGLKALMGKGHMVLTIDQGPDMERYQGVTPLDAPTLEEAAVAYFDKSEQIPTAVRLAVGRMSRPGEHPVWRAGAIIAQFVPGEGGDRERGEAALRTDEDREIWERSAAFLKTTQADELLDPGITAETLLYRLFQEDGVRVFDAKPVRSACGCGPARIESVLQRYEPSELADLAENGVIGVSCEFCRTEYKFSPEGRHLSVI